MLKVKMIIYPMFFKTVELFQHIVIVHCTEECFYSILKPRNCSKNEVVEFISDTERVLKVNLSQSTNELFNNHKNLLEQKI